MWSETEAKKKLCPFIRRGVMIPDVVTQDVPQYCVASQCMAWRWELTKEGLSPGRASAAGMAYGLAYAMQPTTYERGHCGAAGESSGRPPIITAPSGEEDAA